MTRMDRTTTFMPTETWRALAAQASRTSCVDAVAREYKVPRENVTPTSDSQSMKDGFYVVTLSLGPGAAVNCTVNENGVVSDVIRAR